MKRFYKFLMSAAMIMALTVPWTARAQDTVTIGTGTSTTYYVPFNSLYGYSFTEQVYSADDINMAGQISVVQFYLGTSSSAVQTNDIVLYMKNVDRTGFSTTSDYEEVTAADIVYSGQWTIPASYTGWLTIELDTPFDYDGSSNLMVAMHESTSGYSTRYFTYTSVSNSGISFYSDSYNPDPYNLTSYSGSVYLRSYLANMRLAITQGEITCNRVRNVTASNIAPWSCTLNWVDTLNSSATYNIMDMADSSILASGISGTTYDLTDLLPDHTYNFGVYADCGAGDESSIARIVVHTLVSCPPPTQLTLDSVGTDYITFHWTPGYEETEWVIMVGDSAIDGIVDTFYTITDLTVNTVYNLSVIAVCDAEDSSAASTMSIRTLAGLPISEFPYTCGFEVNEEEGINEATDWVLENGTQTNYWMVGDATANGGTQSLYITNDGSSNSYTVTTSSYVFAYATFSFEAGEYAYSYDWKAYGESSYDFIRAAVVPADIDFTAGDYCGFNNTSAVPTGGIAIDGAYRQNLQSSWQTQTGTFNIATDGIYRMVFLWRNDPSSGTQPPAAIDNIQVVQNTCPAPTDLTATAVTSDSITIVWNAGGSETAWQVTIADGEPVDVVDTTYVFDELSPNTIYNIKVRGICGDGDTSMWTSLMVRTGCALLTADDLPMFEDFENQPTGSSSSSTFIPCWGHLNDGSYPGYPYVSSSTTYNHTEGGTKGIYWYYYNTSSYGNHQIIVLPGVDTDDVAINTLRLTFWAKPSSTSYEPVFYAGVMTDPAEDSTFQYYDTILIDHSSTNWAKYTVLFNEFTGNGQYVAIRANLPSSYWYTYVDDITLDLIPACPAVEDIAVVTSANSAIASWNVVGNTYTGALVEYKVDSLESWNSVIVSGTPYAVLTGLDAETHYDLRVSAICDDAEGMAVSSTFTTKGFGCAVIDSTNSHSDTIGNGTTSNSYLPTYSFYNYCLTQQIYTAAEIGQGGTITSIAVMPSVVNSQRTFEIYMAHTSANTLSSFIHPTDMVKVYNGAPVTLTANQWVTFNLDAPFNYDGSSNLLVCFRDMTGSYTTANQYYVHSISGNSVYIYQDGGAYDPFTTSGGYTTSNRNNMVFNMLACSQQSACSAPVAIVSDITSTTAEVVWAPGSIDTVWNIYYRQHGDDAWITEATNTTATSHTFTGLASGTPYEFMVEAVCSESLSTVVDGTTYCAAISSLPYTENFNNWGIGSGVMPNCWYRTGSYSSYTYISGSYNHGGGTGGSIYMYQSGTYHSTIFMPALDTNLYQVNQTQLVFHAMNANADYLHSGFEVGVLSDPFDITTFVPVDTVYHTVEANVWEIFEVPLANYTGNGAYIGLRTVDNPLSGTQYTYTYPYLDDFTLELIPTCPRPDSLTATNATTTSVDLGWHERGSATQWIIEYGPRGFELGTGTVVPASTNPFTLTGIPSAYQGEFYVKSVCGAGDTGDYSRSPFAFGTSQIPATLPYHYTFEDGAEWANWQTSTNHATANWYRGTDVADSGSYSMYIANSETGYFDYSFNSVVNAAAYRDIDFGPIDSSYTITFSARVGGTLSASYDGMMVFLVDPSIAPVASASNITSPWGNVNDLYRIATVRLDTAWNTYSASFDTISGIHRVAFFWFNQNTGSDYDNIPQAAAVDNIDIRYSTCPRPVNLAASNEASTSADLTWQAASNANYEVVYRRVGSANETVYSTSNSITLTGLEPNSEYRVWVRKVCGEGDTSLYSDGISFFTTMCDGAVMATNFDSTMSVYNSGSGYSPIGYSLYNYSYTQTIIDSAHMAAFAGSEITAFGFMPLDANAGCEEFDGMYVYMANVSESDLSSGFIHPDSNHVFVPVISNSNFNYGESDINTWIFHSFDTAFTWDGHSNVLFAVNRINGTWASTTYFAAHTHSGSVMRYDYNDDDQYDINSVSGGYTSTTVGDITFITCGAGCPMPTAAVSNIEAQSATVTVIGGSGISYEFEYGTDNANLGNTMTSTTGIFNLTGLEPETQYFYAVRQQCDSANISNWYTGTFTTDELGCLPPTGLNVTGTGYNEVSLAWTIGNQEAAWDVHVFSSTIDTIVTVTATNATVGGLEADMTYNAAVRALCGANSDVPGPWSDTVQFTTDACQATTGVSVTAASTTATVTWNDMGSSSYRVIWGLLPFNPQDLAGEATVTTTSYTITGLDQEEDYAVVVYNNCAAGLSVPSATVNFSTIAGGQDPTMYTITVTSNNNAWGTVTGSGTYAEGTTVTITATANEGYHFEQWNDGNTNASRTITVTGDATYMANFAEDGTVLTYYTVTATSNNNAWGSVNGGGSYAEGTTVTLTATPSNGYHFVQWVDASQNVLSTANPYTFTATADVSVTAVFEADAQGIDDVTAGTMSLYPNPATTSVTLGLEGFEGVATVDVVDMNGRVIANYEVRNSKLEISVADMAPGAYFVRVTSGTQTAVRKLVVK